MKKNSTILSDEQLTILKLIFPFRMQNIKINKFLKKIRKSDNFVDDKDFISPDSRHFDHIEELAIGEQRVIHAFDYKISTNKTFGPSPLPCVWLDGQCLIFTRKAIESGLTFSECFDWHFYDGDVCFSARQKGLKVGTAPILATHASCGQSMMKNKDAYMKSQKLFINKWFQKIHSNPLT